MRKISLFVLLRKALRDAKSLIGPWWLYSRAPLFLCLLSVFLGHSYGREIDTGPLQMEVYTAEVHSGGDYSHKIAEDSKGIIYVGNEAGTLVFNGSSWSKLPPTGHNPITIAVAVDSRDRIWTGGLHLGYYEPNALGNLSYVDLTDPFTQSMRKEEFGVIWDIFFDQESVYIVTNFHVVHWDGTNWDIHTFDVSRRILPSWADGRLLVHARGFGLYEVSGNNKTKLLGERPEIASGIIRIIGSSENSITVATVDGSFYRLEKERIEQLMLLPEKPDEDATTLAALGLANGSNAVGRAGKISLIDTQGQVYQWTSELIGNVSSFFESRQGCLWVGSSKSIIRIPRLGVSQIPLASQSLIKHDGALFSGTEREINRIRIKGSQAVPDSIASGSLSYSFLSVGRYILYAEEKRLVALAGDRIHDQHPTPRLYHKLIKSSFHDSVFYTLNIPGLSRWSISEEGLNLLNQTADRKLIINSIADIDGQRSIVSTYDSRIGIIHWPPLDRPEAEPILEFLKSQDGLPDGIAASRFFSIGPRPILVTDRGLFAFGTEDFRFSEIDLPVSTIANIWNDVVYCKIPKGNDLLVYLKDPDSATGHRIGLLSFEENGAIDWNPLEIPGLRDAGAVRSLLLEKTRQRDVLWVGTNKNLFRFDIPTESKFPRINVNLLAIEETTGEHSFYGGFGPLPAADNWPFPQKSLRFSFSSPPSVIDVIGYQSRLIGFSENWSGTSELHFREFSNLREGSYTFEVRALDELGRFGPVQRFQFQILPPWYRRSYAYLAYIFSAFALLLFSQRIWTNHLRKRNIQLAALVQERTTELERSNQELREANAVKQNFLASMSHEIRNPLNGILGIAQLLKNQNESNPSRIRHLNACASHLHQLLGQVLDFSSLESGRLHLRPKPFDIEQVMHDVIGMHLVAIEAKSLQLQSQIMPDQNLWIGDPTLLKQVLINLISNAVKYTPSGEIRIRMEHERANQSIRARFTVEDTGPGIPEDKRDYVFEDFTRLHKAGESEVAGTGLGLAIAFQITRFLAGELTIDPDYSEGARFILELPFEAGPAKESHSIKQKEASVRPLIGKRILIADDMDFNRYICRELLEQLGASVEEAGNGREALEKLNAADYFIALLDINMPEMDGNAVVQTYLAQHVGQPPIFIALTAHATGEMEQRALQAGFNFFIEKPLEEDHLAVFTQKLVHRKRPDAKKDLLSYLSEGRGSHKSDLEARYERAINEQIDILQRDIDKDDYEGASRQLHKLRGLANLKRVPDMLSAVDALSHALSPPCDPESIRAACDVLRGQAPSATHHNQ